MDRDDQVASDSDSSAEELEILFARAAALAVEAPAMALPLAGTLLDRAPSSPEVHRLLGRIHRALGDDASARHAELSAIRLSVGDPELQHAALALAANDLPAAEPILRNRLKHTPHDVAAIRMLAELAGRIGRYRDAEALLRRALELAPGFAAARSNLATALYRQNRTAEALAELDRLLDSDPGNLAHANLKAAALGRIGDFDEAIGLYQAVLDKLPGHAKVWMSYGHVLKTVGRQPEAIDAYRRAIAIVPSLGEAWWSLANLKTVKLDAADIAAMEGALAGADLSEEDRFHLDFALGKAFDDAGEHASAFGHYRAGNALRKTQINYDADRITREVDELCDIFNPAFLADRAGQGCPATDPIFILGMPRAGSTLIEQILSCHSMVEGTMELPDIQILATRLGGSEGRYPKEVRDLDAAATEALGQEYLDRTRIQRREGKPHFIDKMPNNWLHAGLIHLTLPNARIIDARRHPLDCGFSNYRQHFARGQNFSYDLADMGRYYADYVRLMAHFDRVLPGRIIRVMHEPLLDDPDGQIRALLDALQLPFEQACLDFHASTRAVRTASSEQVRRPINRDGVGQWRPYAQWLAPLRDALGPLLDACPDLPSLCSNSNTVQN